MFLFIACLVHSQMYPFQKVEKREREKDCIEAHSPCGISQWGPQTPSEFPPPSPYSYPYAEPFHEKAPSLEMERPEALPAEVCFDYVVFEFCIEFCLTVL